MFDELEKLLQDYECLEPKLNPNYINIPCTVLTPNDENMNLFNKLLKLVRETNMKRVIRTESGGICTDVGFRIPSYDYKTSNSGVELLILLSTGFYRIQFRPKMAKDDNTNKDMSGRKAFKKFTELLETYNINIEDYAVDNGLKVKEEIEKPLIKLEHECYSDLTIDNCHHIDFHNSYPGGLKITHPEFGPIIDELYEKRKENSVYKAILNYTIGFMQSKWVNYKYATLSRDAIKNNNDRVRYIAELLKKSGRVIIAYNTDGIWYRGDIFHGDLEGKQVGQWENDHTNCTIRFKSAGCYEYIENGNYTPVVRGYTNLDKVKDRSKWTWGDIYNAGEIIYMFDEDGIYQVRGEL